METKKLQLGELIEKYRFFIGGGLLILILIGSGLLLYRENYQKPTLESRITELESRIDQIETEGNKTEETSIQTPTAQAEEQGQVAGVSSQGTVV